MTDAEIGRAVRLVLLAEFAYQEALDRAERKAELRYRTEGFRIVKRHIDHARDPDADEDRWEITDADTGERLAAGVGMRGFEAVWRDDWCEDEYIGDQAFNSVERADVDAGVPDEFYVALRDWASNNPGEARALIGMSGDTAP